MAFSRDTFEQTLRDIETHLGYLRGNENAWKYLREIQQQSVGSEHPLLDVMRLDEGYSFPCPDGRFKVEPSRTWWIDIRMPVDSKFDVDNYRKLIHQGADMAWQDGAAWASGVAGYASSVCNQFLQPDVPAMVSTILEMQRNAVIPLTQATVDDWAKLGTLPTQWHGEAGNAFYEFYSNYNESIGICGSFLGMVTFGFSAAAKVISGTQFGAQFFLDSVLEGLKAQLDQWAHYDMEPPEPVDVPTWVADIQKIGSSALDLLADTVPVVGDAVKKVTDFQGHVDKSRALIKDIEDVSGKDILPEKHTLIEVKTAEQIYTGLTETLYNDYYGAYNDALDSLQAGGTGSSVPDPNNLAGSAYSGDGVEKQMSDLRNQIQLPHVPNRSLRGEDSYN
jgi:hypothetical protein